MQRTRPQNNSQRNGLWSQSKCTNLMPYDPYFSEIDNLAKRTNIFKHRGNTRYYTQTPVKGLIHALSISDIKDALNQIPKRFTTGIKGIFLCSGSKKQRRANSTTFGCYDGFHQSIFLFPFYEDKNLFFDTRPKPSHCLEYERHGATWIPYGKGGYFAFSEESLRSFYIWDVLYHEVGHHIDYMSGWNHKNNEEKERFAEWFALEYGMKNKRSES